MVFSKLLDVEDRIFTERRLRFYGSGAVVAVLLAALLSWGIHRDNWAIRPDGTLGTIDFCWIWVSGKFAAQSDPSRIYDHALYAAAQNIFYRPGECLFLHQYVYPPTFLFWTYPLGLMRYLAAFAVWILATFVLYQAAIYAVIPRFTIIILAVAPIAVSKNFQLGHTGFFIAGLLGLSLVFMEHRPWLSGIFLGLLTVKPQYGVLFPIALLASRNWRALTSASAATIAFAVAAGLAFGFQGWPSFIGTLVDRNAGLSPDGQVELRLQSIYGLLHWAGASISVSWAGQSATAAAIILTVCAAWAKPLPYSLKAAVLCIGAIVFTPYVLAYDLCILSLAVAFLVSDGLERGFLAGERTILFLCFASLFLVSLPIGSVVCVVLLSLAGRRIMAYRKLAQAVAVSAAAKNFEIRAFAGD